MTSSLKIKGCQTPRIGNFPEAEFTTAGDKAIKLATKLGIKLDPWQKYVLRNALAEITDPDDLEGKIWAAHTVGLVVPRQNGKTFVLIVLILAALFLFHEKVLLTSQRLENAEAVLLEVADFIENSPASLGLKKKLARNWLRKKNGSHRITLNTGAVLMVCARGNAARSKTIDRIIHDEAYDYSDEDEAALGYTLAARPNPQTWFVSTPPLTAAVDGPFSRLRAAGHAGETGTAWFEWSIDLTKPIETLDLNDRKLWAEANPAYGRIKDRTIEAEIKRSSRADFARERLGVWPVKAGNALIKSPDWEALKDEQSKRQGDIAIAVDTCGAGDKAMTSIALYGIREDGLGHLEVIENRAGTDWVVKRLGELKEKHNPVAIGFDVKGPIGSLLIDLQKVGFKVPDDPEEPEYGDLAIPRSTEFSPACVQFVDAVIQKTFRHRGQLQLTNAVAAAKTRKVGDSWAWDRFKSETDISPLVAATLARWAYETRAHLVQHDYEIENSLWFG
ncbi:hypothetical protein V6U89_29805 [Micromonospora sp. CPCC 206171]|uniref:hypothetical protein n=1 Tax=Micromonospora sp. CPCC 206171 TaxID=3122405 RepID=UPI002FF42DCE